MKAKMNVVRVTQTEFEMEDGTVYPHPFPLESVPSLEEFQSFYDIWRSRFHRDQDEEPADD